jgi:hypothetical protein
MMIDRRLAFKQEQRKWTNLKHDSSGLGQRGAEGARRPVRIPTGPDVFVSSTSVKAEDEES